jgi:hypothetical protein
MAKVDANGIQIEYETFGEPSLGCAILPYVLNGPIYLFLFEIFPMSVEVDIFHNTSMLQDLLQICKVC